MKITIMHLFHDLLNLYGESGNIVALKNALESQNIEVVIKDVSINNNLNLEDVDVVYLGAGTEHNQLIALNYLKKHKDEISQFIMNNKFFIATGNSIELFGKFILNNNENLDTLDVFDYFTEYSKNRLVSECVFKFDEVEDLILGFENQQGLTKNSSNPLFSVIKGHGSKQDAGVEGFKYNNFYATYLLGPLFVRNPKLLENFCRKIILSIDSQYVISEFNFSIEQKAHDKFLTKYDKIN